MTEWFPAVEDLSSYYYKLILLSLSSKNSGVSNEMQLLFSLVLSVSTFKVENWIFDSWAIDVSDENFPPNICESNSGDYEWTSCEIGSFFSSELLRKKVHFFRRPLSQKIKLEANIGPEFLERIKTSLSSRNINSKEKQSTSCPTYDASDVPLLKAFVHVTNQDKRTFHEVDLFFHRNGEKYNFQYRARSACSPSALENGCSQVIWMKYLTEKISYKSYSAIQKNSSANCTFPNISRPFKISQPLRRCIIWKWI